MSEKLLEVVHYIGRDSGKTEELLNLLKGIYSRMVGESKNIQELLRCLSLSSFSPGQKEIIKKLIMSVFVDEILDPDFKLDGSLRSIVTEMINNWYIKLIDGKEYDSE